MSAQVLARRTYLAILIDHDYATREVRSRKCRHRIVIYGLQECHLLGLIYKINAQSY
jgi:hypothetical protein